TSRCGLRLSRRLAGVVEGVGEAKRSATKSRGARGTPIDLENVLGKHHRGGFGVHEASTRRRVPKPADKPGVNLVVGIKLLASDREGDRGQPVRARCAPPELRGLDRAVAARFHL